MSTRASILLAIAAATFAVPASAGPAAPPACSASDLGNVSVLGCSGYVTGNLISNKASSRDAVADFLESLGLPDTSGLWIEKLSDLSGQTAFGFDTPLYGISYIGVHKGGAGEGGQGTAFYRFDAGSTGITSLTYGLNGLSNAALYATQAAPVPEPAAAVPEPAPAALLLAALGAFALTRRRQAGR